MMKRPTLKRKPSKKGQFLSEELLAELKSLDPHEFELRFLAMLDEMNIHKELRESILNKDVETKCNMMIQFSRNAELSKHVKSQKPQTSAEFLSELSKKDQTPDYLLAVLQLLRVRLSTSRISFIDELSQVCSKKIKLIMIDHLPAISNHFVIGIKILHECIRCIKSFMDSPSGLQTIMGDSEAIESLVACVAIESHTLMEMSVRLLAIMYLLNHVPVLACVSRVARRNNEPRFQRFVAGLQPEMPFSLKLNCLMCINAFISETEDFKLRTFLRFEFNRCGLSQAITHLKKIDHPSINVHLDVYENSLDDDLGELQNKLHTLTQYFITTEEACDILLKSIKDTPSENYFLGILHRLLCIDGDDIRKKCYFQLAEDFLTQMVLQRNGHDYEFTEKIFEYNIDSIIDGLGNKIALDELSSRLENMEQKYSAEVLAKNELEVKLNLANKEIEINRKGVEGETEKMQKSILEYQKKIVELNDQINALKSGKIQSSAIISTTSPEIVSVLETSAIEEVLPPPPPPPCFEDICPPPPPPPDFGECCPPPPPPPGFSAMSPKSTAPMRKKYTQPKTTKRLNWTKIPYSKMDEKSLWKNIDETKFEKSELFDKIIEHFSAKKTQAFGNMNPMAESASKKKTKEPIVIDGKTVQNLSIFLNRTKISYEEFKKRLFQWDKTIFTESYIETLKKMLPSADQRNILMEYEGNLDELCDAELFIKTISSVPDLDLRLDYMYTESRFYEIIGDVKSQMVVVRSACEEITHCNKLMDIFQIILLCGNYMNAGSRNEGSFGFELSFLNSLADTKTQSGSSFIHFLAEIIEEHYSQLIGFDKNLTSIQSAMKVNDDSVTKVVNQVAKTVSQLESNLSKFETPFNSDDKFPEILTDFHKKASEQLIILQEMFDNMKKSFDDICNYFSITTKFTIEEFFSLFNKFMEDWNKACSDNKRKAEKLERDRIAKERKEQDALKKNKKPAVGGFKLPFSGSSTNESNDMKNDGMMDNLIESLQSGKAFRQKVVTKVSISKKNNPNSSEAKKLLLERKRTINMNVREEMLQMLKQSTEKDNSQNEESF